MELIGTYQIDDLTVVNPTIKIKRSLDDFIDKTCVIEVIFNVENALIDYSRFISGFTYVDTWEDSDIENFVVSELEKMKL